MLSSIQFVDALRNSKLEGGFFGIRERVLGLSDTVFVNFINAPPGSRGVDYENNRLMFSVSGFDSLSEDRPVERLRVQIVMSVFQRKYRTRTIMAEKAVEDIVEFCNQIALNNTPSIAKAKYGTP